MVSEFLMGRFGEHGLFPEVRGEIALGFGEGIKASTPGGGDETHQHRVTEVSLLAGDDVGLADLVSPVASLTGTIEGLARMMVPVIAVATFLEHLKPALTVHCSPQWDYINAFNWLFWPVQVFFCMAVFKTFSLRDTPRKSHYIRFLDEWGEEIHLYQRHDLHVLDQVDQLGEGDSLLVVFLASMSSVPQVPTKTLAQMLLPNPPWKQL